ncbi:hypothetical protein Tsubulata_035764 [Turnera subulata]|uniref:KIB1-4 beta-propeller domain-containing protein n=1 Tax=Turnera subulata TaxID=218843 RepID=A0A9Q0JF39_9ROSI|nr:hypothetical protein Tsubulata_035764 [Turnera subulata]
MPSLWSRIRRLGSTEQEEEEEEGSSCRVVPTFERDHDNKVPPLGNNEVQEFPLPLTSYPVLMLPVTHTTCRLFNPVTGKFTRFSYPDGGKISYSSSIPAFSNGHGWVSYFTNNDCSMILSNNVLSDSNPSATAITLPPFHTIPNLHSLPIEAADPDLKAAAPPGTDCFFYYTNVRDGEEVIKFLPRRLMVEMILGCFALSSSSPTEDNCVAFLSPGRYLRHTLGIDFAFCRIGDARWSTAPLCLDHYNKVDQCFIEKVVYSRREKLFYVLSRHMCIQVVEFNDDDPASLPKRLCSPHCVPVDPYRVAYELYRDEVLPVYHSMYLVETPQRDPLLVLHYFVPIEYDDEEEEGKYRSVGFHVYKLCFDRQKVVAEEFFLDDTALLVDVASFVCVSVRDDPGLMPNSVYFFGRHEIGFYNLLDRAFTHFYQPFEMLMEEISGQPMWVSRPQL